MLQATAEKEVVLRHAGTSSKGWHWLGNFVALCQIFADTFFTVSADRN
jgi:hypothetical protein